MNQVNHPTQNFHPKLAMQVPDEDPNQEVGRAVVILHSHALEFEITCRVRSEIG